MIDQAYKTIPRGGNRPGEDRLTQRQEWIWLWMLQFQAERRRPSTIRELMTATGIGSKHGVSEQLKALINKRFVLPGEYRKSRTVVAVDPVVVPTEKGREYVESRHRS